MGKKGLDRCSPRLPRCARATTFGTPSHASNRSVRLFAAWRTLCGCSCEGLTAACVWADNQALLRRIKQFFVTSHDSVNDSLTPRQREALLNANNLHEFMVAATPLSRTDSRVKLASLFDERDDEDGTPGVGTQAGSADGSDAGDFAWAQLLSEPEYRTAFRDYMKRCNPMGVAHLITTPLLMVNAADDPVCVAENIPVGGEAQSMCAHGTTVLAVTAKGRFVILPR